MYFSGTWSLANPHRRDESPEVSLNAISQVQDSLVEGNKCNVEFQMHLLDQKSSWYDPRLVSIYTSVFLG